MKTYGRLNPEAFEALLSWLSPNRQEAASRFVELKKSLDVFFSRGSCHIPDELFYETVNRAGVKAQRGEVECSVDPIAYCRGVATNVLREYWRDLKPEPLPPDPPFDQADPEWDERELACLDGCLERLSTQDRELVTRYYRYHGREKIEDRKEMAAREGGVNALRIKLFRIRNTLRICVSRCVDEDRRATEQ